MSRTRATVLIAAGIAIITAAVIWAVHLPPSGTTANTAAASATSSTPAPAIWSAPAAYDFVLAGDCHRGPTSGRWHVTVAGNVIVQVTPLDAGLSAPASFGDFPTLSDLLQRARDAITRGDEATLAVDPADGHPTRVTFGRSAASTDGATCFTISQYHA
ncbi:hypothetical protein Acy02nite_60950 [Actinoplanes cyaneus]|uniref:Uncharacterized protein n=1 Tax=Actinoplanes cyaneus TaxID=52696 RepID=A0A919IM57_9ACTN|nr:DUF6174 domain-containing protein [Actinoplanes cyaneus]MCW2141704.1 hypothetical protein [Actinoplanes cyaneus]GID68214.1 hypothetical protein Acy02nite_60950 [Actinoplanes cyaneus]